MSINSFETKKFEDFKIVDAGGETVGHIRVKPSGVLWSPKGAHVWYGLALAKFSEIMEAQGKRQKK